MKSFSHKYQFGYPCLRLKDFGIFVHIMDAEVNKIELLEPIDSVLTQMGGETNK